MTGTVAFIFARGGSSFRGKNLRLLHGRSLLARAINICKAVKTIDRVIVSTDDEDIAEAARAEGAEVPFRRPAELASATAPEWLAWRHAVSWIRENEGPQALRRFIAVPATSPLRARSDIEACLTAYDGGGWDLVLTVRPAERNPYFNMVELESDGRARFVLNPDKPITHRQSAPAMYDIAGVAYVTSPDFILEANGLFDGRTGVVIVPKERAVDIDDEWDLVTAEAFYARMGAPALENQ